MSVNDVGPDEPVFLIVMAEALVAADMSETIRERIPGARVLEASTMDAAADLLRAVGRLDLAFVAASGEAFEASPLAGHVAARGGEVVLLGHTAERQPARWRVLDFPFTVADLVRLLTCVDGNHKRC